MRTAALSIAVLIASVAYGGGVFTKKYVQPATTAAGNVPTVATQSGVCIPLSHTLSHSPVTELEVTVMDHNDGGQADDEYLVGARVSAFRYDPTAVMLDGGGAIVSEPAYDFAIRDLTLDGRAPTRAQTARFTLPSKGIENATENAKICFAVWNATTDGGSVVDGGAPLVTDVILRGRY